MLTKKLHKFIKVPIKTIFQLINWTKLPPQKHVPNKYSKYIY